MYAICCDVACLDTDSPIQDLYSGTHAFVAYFCPTPHRASDGGALRFYSAKTKTWVLSILPGKNKLVVFRTRRPFGPMHEVEVVNAGEGQFR